MNMPAAYPATYAVDTPPTIARWRPLVQWFLAIPHLILSAALNYVAQACAVISWFAILFTGRMPEGLANVICMSLRYNNRAMSYAGFLHDTYPPFEFSTAPADPGGHPARTDFVPALGGRNRLTVGLRLIWLIPAAIVTVIILLVTAICWFVAFWAVLFTGKWPAGLRSWVLKGMRAQTRLSAYSNLLTDQYPPLNFD